MLRRLAVGLANLIEGFTTLQRPVRRLTAFAIDVLFCFAAAWVAFALRLGDWSDHGDSVVVLWAVALLFWIPIALRGGVYRSLVRYSSGRTFAGLFAACVQLSAPMVIVFGIVQIPGVPRTLSILHPIIFFLALVLSRLGMRYILIDLLAIARGENSARKRILICGAGRAGQQLASSLRHELHLDLVGFVDHDHRLDGQKVDGTTVWHFSRLRDVVAEQRIDEVLLAIPSVSRARRREIVSQLQELNVQVRILPALGHIIDGRISVNDLRDVQVEDLLGRDPVPPDQFLINASISGKVVLVTGAGGSIGSELCRQIIKAHPRRLILVDQSEYSLYTIDSELRERVEREGLTLEIIPELADVADRETVARVFRRWRAETVYHAAAYKHVPLLETNPIAGLRNNIFGTLHCALASEATNVERFILISTDKAVRPTNVMGASKRICELILQARAQQQSGTLFTMVRFGNVLGSSGSVVPKFRAQIAAGGPVTLTHREVTRYFMTIPEAAQLVLQAASLARGGEVFVLDMGQSVRVLELAETMIRLSGLSVRDSHSPDGDIEIVEVGLRPGEKLFEELLIGENPQPTLHPRILQARENMIDWPQLSRTLELLASELNIGDVPAAIDILRRLLPEFAPRSSTFQSPLRMEDVSTSANSKLPTS